MPNHGFERLRCKSTTFGTLTESDSKFQITRFVFLPLDGENRAESNEVVRLSFTYRVPRERRCLNPPKCLGPGFAGLAPKRCADVFLDPCTVKEVVNRVLVGLEKLINDEAASLKWDL